MSGGLIGTAPTGLYGWIQGNNARSVQFFVLFALAVQALAVLALFLPLTLFDEAHSPLFSPIGYLTRYVPAVLVISVAIFGAQLFWYMETVKRRAGFRFVDDADEPRLCRLIEPLIIQMNMAPPFVAVIESPACNAFACGISRKYAVVVVTRGLLDKLTDTELETVLAHELSHIRNGDIRMMAAANICMANLQQLDKANILQFRHVLAGVWCLAFPVFFPLMLFGGLIGQAAMRAAWRARFTIISSREFVADAQAVQLTKNPAALAKALTRIRGNERIEGLTDQDDAMMISGRSEGPDATHPEVEDRIEALALVTGPMVFNAPGAADPSQLGDAEAVAARKGSRRLTARQRARRALGTNLLGMTPLSRIAFAVTVGLFLLIHMPELGNGRAMAAKFDIRPLGLVIGIHELKCAVNGTSNDECKAQYNGLWRTFEGQRGTFVGVMADINGRRHKEGAETAVTLLNSSPGEMRPYTGQSGRLTGVKAEMDERGLFATGGTTFSSDPPEKLKIAEVEQVGCFQADLIHGDPAGHFGIREAPGGTSIEGYIGLAQVSLIRYGEPGSADSREWLRKYAERRENMLRVSYDLFGLEGLAALKLTYDAPSHDRVLEELATEAAKPEFTRGMTQLQRATIKALINNPERFVPCEAVRHGA